MLDRVIFFTLLPYFYDILDIIKYDCSRKSAKEILFMNKENRKAARERRAKEREHEAKVAHYKKIWSWAGPALIVVVIVGLIIASVLDSKRLSAKSASEDTSTASSAASASSASTSASASLQTDTSLTIEDGDTVNIDYVGSIDGVEFEGGNTKGNGADLVIGSHTYVIAVAARNRLLSGKFSIAMIRLVNGNATIVCTTATASGRKKTVTTCD